MAAGGGRKAVIAALVANAGIAVAKFVGFLLTQSASMLAESIHSAADSGNQGLLLFGGSRSTRKESEKHPFGYARTRYFWSFVVAVVLFALGSLFSLFEGYEKLREPHEITSAEIAIGILVGAIALESWSFRTAIVESRPLKGARSWWQFVRETKVPELTVVLLEDLGALVGLVLALIGVGLALVTGDPVWDAISTLAIGALLGLISVILAIEMKSLLLGESADPHDVRAVHKAVIGTSGIDELMELRTQHLGPDEVLIAGQVRMSPGLDLASVVAIIDQAEATIRAAVPFTTYIFLEPDTGGTREEPAAPTGAPETAGDHH